MKKILSLLVLVAAFASCEEDIKFNNPAVQGLKDNELWKATEFWAEKNGNTVIVTAKNDVETVVLTINAPAPGSVHDFGGSSVNSASYQLDVDGIEGYYVSNPDGNGRIVIRGEADNNINGTGGKGFISGSFYFNAYNEEGDAVNYQQGVFYKVPITVNQ